MEIEKYGIENGERLQGERYDETPKKDSTIERCIHKQNMFTFRIANRTRYAVFFKARKYCVLKCSIFVIIL